MLDFKEQNDKERAFYTQDFSVVAELLKRIRSSLISGKTLTIKDLDLFI